MRRGLARFHDGQSGAAMLEFALALPLLLVLVAGLVDVGRGLIVFSAMERNAAAAARFLARLPAPGCNPLCTPEQSRALAFGAARIKAETGVAAELRASGPRDGIITVAADVDLEPWAFPAWAVGPRHIAVSKREQHAAF